MTYESIVITYYNKVRFHDYIHNIDVKTFASHSLPYQSIKYAGFLLTWLEHQSYRTLPANIQFDRVVSTIYTEIRNFPSSASRSRLHQVSKEELVYIQGLGMQLCAN